MANGKKLTCIDLFCGAGGFSQGFRQQGFSVLAANDIDPCAAQTYRLSHPETLFIQGPIETVKPKLLMEALNFAPGDLDCLIGGPPCQAYSVYNHQRGFHDERSGLFREYLRLVEGLQPKSVVIENVTGILSAGEGRAVEEIHKRLSKLGYQVNQDTLKAEEFGVPQERRRVFFVGTRSDSAPFEFPYPTHGPGRLPFVTVSDAILDLPHLEILEGDEIADYGCAPFSPYQQLLRKKSKTLFNHVAPGLAPINIERLQHIPQGGSWRDIPIELLPAGMKKARRCDHTKRYGRLHPNGLACTILTKCDLHWGAFIHPTQQRTLTVREAARFQSFPDNIRILGSRIEQFKQVGNAVPPLLAEAIAGALRKHLLSLERSESKCSKLTLAV
ncbi:MAG: DNA cytosine methyltransferase [Candidatus Hydrogenedentes bacterium]|nr:DNA cytosine methyltransferase [Candidatus Hydrogenedentota bacterium]